MAEDASNQNSPLGPSDEGESKAVEMVSGDVSVVQRPRLLSGVFRSIAVWNPQPLQKPSVNPDLPLMPGGRRTAEVARFTLLRFEYWIAPTGWLREWLRFILRVFLLVSLPTFSIGPLVCIISYGAAMVAENLEAMALGLLKFSFYAFLTLVVLRICLVLLTTFLIPVSIGKTRG